MLTSTVWGRRPFFFSFFFPALLVHFHPPVCLSVLSLFRIISRVIVSFVLRVINLLSFTSMPLIPGPAGDPTRHLGR